MSNLRKALGPITRRRTGLGNSPGIFHSAVTVRLGSLDLNPTEKKTGIAKAAAIDRLRECLAPDPFPPVLSAARGSQDAAVILVSRSLAPWLADDVFISRVLDAAKFSSFPGERELSVLAAVVDEVPCFDPRTDSFGSSEGISVLLDDAKHLMPRLWLSAGPPTTPQQAQQAQQASLDFHLRQTPRLKVTVPVANTLFTTDKPHVLFASRWLAGQTHGLKLVEKAEKTKATLHIRHRRNEKPARLLANLIPVTRPRKVLASLGNILSKIEIDGQPAPPSQELETILPALLKARRERLHGSSPDGPPPASIGVWALTTPKKALFAYGKYSKAEKQQYGSWNLLLEAGCQLSKVLSGGGGWGLKQGLLSLDPQTTFDTDEDRDLQRFMTSFQGEEADPEKFVQFFIEGPHPPKAFLSSPPANVTSRGPLLGTPTTVIGTPGAMFESAAAMPRGASAYPGLFGAVSEAGVYLESPDPRHSIATKIDASHSYVAWGPTPWQSSGSASSRRGP